MAVLDTTYGNLVIKDVAHALDKDTRTLFAADNRKAQSHDVPELHLLSYYGDITGPKELNLRNKCLHLISNTLQNNRSKHKENPQRLRCQSMFEECSLNIMHISHYSIEFILNITNTPLLDEYKLDDNNAFIGTNKYLVGTYQNSGYGGAVDELITMGITSNIAYRDNISLSNFYLDDFIQDLYKILRHSSWYDESCELPSLLFYTIAQFTMDCILPVTYTRSDDDEVILDEGELHLFLTGCLSPHQYNESDDAKHDMAKLECIGRILCELGQIVYTEYNANKNAKKLKSEYDKWKSKGFKKRKKCRPPNMRALTLQLELHRRQRNHAQSRQSINDLKYLYFKNPNFALKLKKQRFVAHSKASTAQPSAMQSFKKFFSFGKNNIKQYPNSLPQPELAHRRSQSADIRTVKHAINKRKKNKKKKKNKRSAYDEWEMDEHYNWNNNDYGTQYITTSSQFISSSSTNPVGWEAAASVPVEERGKVNLKPSPMLRAQSTGNKKKYDVKRKIKKRGRNKAVINKKNKYTHPRTNGNRQFMSLELLLNTNNYKMDPNDDDELAILEESKSAESEPKLMRTKSPKLIKTMMKPQKTRSFESSQEKSDTNKDTSPYAHDDNEVMYLESYKVSNDKIPTRRRKESLTTIKVKDIIRSMYREYEREKGKVPSDVQAFLEYCKRKKVKKAKWTLCKDVMKEMRKGFKVNSNEFVEMNGTINE